MENLTERQKRTYELIFTKSSMGEEVSQREIYENYKYLDENGNVLNRDGYVWNDDPKSHDHCAAIWNDIEKINKCAEINELIISPTPYVYRFANTKEEVAEYMREKFLFPAIQKLIRYNNFKNKIKRNGQFKFDFETNETVEQETFIRKLLRTENNE